MSIASPVTPCRFPLIDPATATDPVVCAVFSEIERELGFGIVPNVFRAMPTQPASLRATWDLFLSTVLQGTLPRIIKELVGIVVSAANNGEYALKLHMHSLGVQGVANDILVALSSSLDTAPNLTESVATIIKVVHKAVYNGSLSVNDSDLAGLADEGITQVELEEIFAAINLFRYINSFTDLARVPVDAI